MPADGTKEDAQACANELASKRQAGLGADNASLLHMTMVRLRLQQTHQAVCTLRNQAIILRQHLRRRERPFKARERLLNYSENTFTLFRLQFFEQLWIGLLNNLLGGAGSRIRRTFGHFEASLGLPTRLVRQSRNRLQWSRNHPEVLQDHRVTTVTFPAEKRQCRSGRRSSQHPSKEPCGEFHFCRVSSYSDSVLQRTCHRASGMRSPFSRETCGSA